MRAALDTDVIVAGLCSSAGASRQLLLLLAQGHFVAVASVAMMLEYEAVLKRPKQLRAIKLTPAEVDTFLDGLATMVIPVTPFFLWRPQLRDPADEHVLETAVNGYADAIITFNIRHYAPAAAQFGIALLRPGEAVYRIRHG